MSQHELNEPVEDLDQSECLRLLEGSGMGRIGVIVRGHPVIFPVNYAVFDDGIWFCARRGGDLDRATVSVTAAFEIDAADNIYHEGWSVLVIGRCVHMTDPAELTHVQGAKLLPWAGGGRDLFIRISIDKVSGRRIRHRET
jgi:nitroimidazol reductase NimA-like FMN-containing flavoprotein (pyridoxamine 5'-phosphate oxidase superfamily)